MLCVHGSRVLYQCVTRTSQLYVGPSPLPLPAAVQKWRYGSTTRRQRVKKRWWQMVISPAEHVALAPGILQRYLRLIRYDKPAGTFLIWYPGVWSLCLSTPSTSLLPDPSLALIFTAGALFMRSAGCVINDLLDKDFDKSVARTRLRPLASGELSPAQALACLAACLGCALSLLVQLNPYTIMLGASAVVPVSIYPLLKRYTYYPQIGLAVTINWGALMGSSAVNGYCDWPVVLPLYLGCCCWTMYYDTIYAHQDKRDDMRVGVKSTALKFGDASPTWLAAFATGSIACWSVAGVFAEQSPVYYVAVAGFGAFYVHQLRHLDINDRANCWARFNAQKYAGGVLLLGCLFGTCFRKKVVRPTDSENNVV